MMNNKYLMNYFNEISAVIPALKMTKLSLRKVVKLLDKGYYTANQW